MNNSEMCCGGVAVRATCPYHGPGAAAIAKAPKVDAATGFVYHNKKAPGGLHQPPTVDLSILSLFEPIDACTGTVEKEFDCPTLTLDPKLDGRVWVGNKPGRVTIPMQAFEIELGPGEFKPETAKTRGDATIECLLLENTSALGFLVHTRIMRTLVGQCWGPERGQPPKKIGEIYTRQPWTYCDRLIPAEGAGGSPQRDQILFGRFGIVVTLPPRYLHDEP